ncbi:hypothetical protein A2755_03240 [Candidatus Wolfebacteria bacterium RIFCSPHIGHO2_01_FULL_48_22]|uniref:Extracellular solute-binding protein n=2 Tax=Candidatus Wolfeibacteriota TaxID=1752735 RepID=A0A1F8DRU9_9BACT|nr:MAG: hypothetical protein A2755_03240 [Candidatus Wolfebacteria bacterium RIFCSPHIGHO2_01_FULL_48_22]OGM92044.1 MAG: hypothetical protein A2935_01730 [Candidatus Wolfebacteria bacterium RIFCSPLOWO2_01_FULL_47_17b]
MTSPIGDIPKSRLIIIGAVIVVIVVAILILQVPPKPGGDPNLPAAANLVVWGLKEDQSAFIDLIKGYQASSEQVSKYKVEFVPFSSGDELERTLVNALAENSGPDIFYFHNSWTEKHKAKVQPATSAIISTASVSRIYPQTVYGDFVDATESGGVTYALPLHMDALGLMYNRDIVQATGVTFDAATWENLSWTDFIHVAQTTKRVQGGMIERAGTALGTSNNVANVTDILSALLLQSATPFIDASNRIVFGGDSKNAFQFYLQFANRLSDNFTWDSSRANSREMFARSGAATIIDYHSSLADIKQKNQFIDAHIVPIPQLESDATKKRTFSSYWGLAVSNFSRQKYAAWHFIKFATTNEAAQTAYLEATGKLPALISLINKRIAADQDSAFLKSFAYARSWRQKDPNTTRIVFNALIDNVQANRLTIDQAAKSAQDSLNQ